MPEIDEDDIEKIASSLGFEVDPEGLSEIAGTAKNLWTEIQTLDDEGGVQEEGPTTVSPSDEYNAFLARYDSPRSSTSTGPLNGTVITIKDTIAVSGLPMTAGSSTFEIKPDFDSVIVERLLQNGAEIDGKSNLEAFAFGITGENSDFGVVQNPKYPNLVPGGSSSGGAAAVAGGLVDAAIGTDAGGSLRIPAACCNLVGAKPTHSLVPRDGLLDFAPSMDTIGPITNDVGTAANILDVIAGSDLRDPSTHRDSIDIMGDFSNSEIDTLGIPRELLRKASREVTAEFQEFLDLVVDTTPVSAVDIDLTLGKIEEAYLIISATEFAWVIRQSDAIRGQGTGYEETLRAGLEKARKSGITSSHMIWRVLPAAYLDELTDGRLYLAAKREVLQLQRQLESVFEDIDVLLTPTLRRTPPEFEQIQTKDDVMDMLGNTSIFNLTGNPVIGVPGHSGESRPFGLQIIAPHFEDARALAGAQLVENVEN